MVLDVVLVIVDDPVSEAQGGTVSDCDVVDDGARVDVVVLEIVDDAVTERD